MPYPPFGLATLTVLNIAGYLILLGIYNSAALVSANDNLRKTIRKHAVQSKLLDLIGHAEMEREIQKTVSDIIRDQELVNTDKETEFELDENELKRYLDVVIRLQISLDISWSNTFWFGSGRKTPKKVAT